MGLITGVLLSGLVFGDTEGPPEETEVSLERTRKEISVSAVGVALWRHTDVMTEAVSSRVTTGCAWATGTMEHAP